MDTNATYEPEKQSFWEDQAQLFTLYEAKNKLHGDVCRWILADFLLREPEPIILDQDYIEMADKEAKEWKMRLVQEQYNVDLEIKLELDELERTKIQRRQRGLIRNIKRKQVEDRVEEEKFIKSTRKFARRRTIRPIKAIKPKEILKSGEIFYLNGRPCIQLEALLDFDLYSI